MKELSNALGVQTLKDSYGRISFRPQGKTEHVAPEILETFYEEDVDEDGKSHFERMYKCEPHPGSQEPRIFKADKYDATFLPAHDIKRIKRK